MFKSQLEPSAENFVETQIFVENIFDTVKKAREAKAARSLAESKLAHYDYSFDFSPSKRKKTRKNAKSKTPKNGKTKTTPKKKPRKPRTPKDSAEKKKKPPTTPKTPRKYTKRAKVKPQNDIDDEEAAFILSSISQRSFDSFYNRFNGTTHVVNKIQIPLETSTVVQPPIQPQTPTTPKKTEPNHLTAYHHVLLDHNYWIVEPPAPTTPTSTVVVTETEPQDDNKLNNESQTSMNLLLTVASHELSSPCTQNSTNSSIKVEVNNNKLPPLDVNCDTPKLSTMSDDNAVKKRWLRQATTECSTPSPTVTPPETSPNDMKAPLKKRRVVRELDDNNEIKIGVCSETESSKIDQTVCFESNNIKNNVEAIKFNNNFVNNSALLKCEPVESVNINLREIHEKIEMEFGRQHKVETQNVIKEEPRSVIQSPIGHQLHGVKNNLTFGIQMNSPVDVNAIYGRSQPENMIKVDQTRGLLGNEGKLPHTQIYDEKLIKIEPHEKPHDYRANNVNIVEVKFNDKIPQVYGMKTEVYDNLQHAIKPEIYEQKQIKTELSIPEKVITVDGKLQQILDGKIQKIYRDNSQYFVDQHVEPKVQNYSHQMSVIQNLDDTTYRNQIENIQKQNHIIIHTGSINDKKMPESYNDQKVYSIYGENHHDGYPKIHQLSPTKAQLSPTKMNQFKGLSSPTKIQISPTRTYEIYTKNPHENIAESLLKLQQESPVKLLQMSPTKVMHTPNYQVAQALTFETSTDHGYQKKSEENSTKKLKKTQKVTKVKTKTPKVKKTPMKAKKAQQKPKKVKAPKSPSKIVKNKKNSVKIDKNLIKNFGNLENVPLKIRQNLAFEEKIMMKMKDNEVRTQRVSESDANEIKMSKIHPIVGLIPPFDSKFQQIGGKIMQVDGKVDDQVQLDQIGVNFSKFEAGFHLDDAKLSQNAKLTPNVTKLTQNDANFPKIDINSTKSDSNHQQIDSKFLKIDAKPHLLHQNHENDTKLLEALSKIHGSDEKSIKIDSKFHQVDENSVKNDTNFQFLHNSHDHVQNDINNIHINNKFTKHSKRTISESSGSSKTSTCSSQSSRTIEDIHNNCTDIIKNSNHQKFQSKKALKKLKFDDSENEKECEVKMRILMDANDQQLGRLARDFMKSPISSQNLTTLSNFQVIKDNYAEKLSKRTISESSSVSSRTLSCNSPDNTPNSSFVHFEAHTPSTSVILTPKVVKLTNSSDESHQKSKIHEESASIASKLSKPAQASPTKQSDDQNSSVLQSNNRKLSLSSLKSPVIDTVDGHCGNKVKITNINQESSVPTAKSSLEPLKKVSESSSAVNEASKSPKVQSERSKCSQSKEVEVDKPVSDVTAVKTVSDVIVDKPVSKINSANSKASPDTVKATSDVSKATSEVIKVTSEVNKTSSDVTKVASDITKATSEVTKPTLDVIKPASDVTKPTSVTNPSKATLDKPTDSTSQITNNPQISTTNSSIPNKSASPTQSIHSSSPKLDDDIIKTIIEPPSILKSLSDGIAPIKQPIIDSLIPFKSTIESIESIIDTTKLNSDTLMPEKVVEQQVASILEKVIPKTLKTDFVKEIEAEMPIKEPETEPIESDNDMDDEDDTTYRECVEEFHKDTLEKLMEANKRFCRENYVHNPFKHSISYDGRDSGRYSKSDDYHSRRDRSYDYDDHRKPLKMSLSFESHQQYSHHNYPQHYQRSISEVFNDPRKERWSSNGMYENRSYGSFHYDKIHHREPITTTYSMYRAQKASQMESRWGSRQNYDYQSEPPHKVNNYVADKPPMATQTQPQPQPITPTVINSYRPIQPEPIRSEPTVLAVSPQAEALKIATSDPFVGFLMDTKLNVSSPAAVLPKTKTASHDPRLNPSLVQDVKKEEPATPKKKLSLDQYRKRKSLTNVTQVSPTDEIMPSISVSITESPSPTLSPAFDPSIAAAAATG